MTKVAVPDTGGAHLYLISSSQKYLPRVIREALGPNEIPVTRIGGHAEYSALLFAKREGLTPIEVAASRPICPNCFFDIVSFGARPASRLR